VECGTLDIHAHEFFCSPVQAQTTQEEELRKLLQAYVQQLSGNPNSEGMSVGYEVYSLEDDKTLAAYLRTQVMRAA
jgi:hypothetical protein